MNCSNFVLLHERREFVILLNYIDMSIKSVLDVLLDIVKCCMVYNKTQAEVLKNNCILVSFSTNKDANLLFPVMV